MQEKFSHEYFSDENMKIINARLDFITKNFELANKITNARIDDLRRERKQNAFFILYLIALAAMQIIIALLLK